MDIARELKQAFEDFRRNHGESLEELRERLDAMEAKSNTLPKPGGFSGRGGPQMKAFRDFLRSGDVSALREAKSLTTTEGGVLVPEELAKEIHNLTVAASPVRAVSRVVKVSTGDYKVPVGTRGIGSGWVGETDARAETDAPGLAEVEAVMGEVYANPAATQTMLDDSQFDVGQWLAEQIADEFSTQENGAFTSGNGVKKPKGFLDYVFTDESDADRDFGKLQYIPTGVDAGFKALGTDTGVGPVDDLLSLVYALKAPLRPGACWMMASTTLATIRKWKDNDGSLIWQPGLQAGQPSTLLGFPVHENEDMPAVGSGAIPIVFGNFQRGYCIVDRITQVLRDPYTNKPYVHFYTTKRVGGMVVDSEAIKGLKTAAS